MNVTERNAVSKMGQPNQVTPTVYVLEIVQEATFEMRTQKFRLQQNSFAILMHDQMNKHSDQTVFQSRGTVYVAQLQLRERRKEETYDRERVLVAFHLLQKFVALG
jgi:hypothetical protein